MAPLVSMAEGLSNVRFFNGVKTGRAMERNRDFQRLAEPNRTSSRIERAIPDPSRRRHFIVP